MRTETVLFITILSGGIVSAPIQADEIQKSILQLRHDSIRAADLLPHTVTAQAPSQPEPSQPHRTSPELAPENAIEANSESNSEPNSDPNLELNPDFVIAPESMSPDDVNPLTSIFIWNDQVLSHLTSWEVGSQLNFGDGRSTNLDGSGVVQLRRYLERSLTTDGLLTLRYNGTFLNASSTVKERSVTVTTETSAVALGFRQQFSLTGTCDAVPANLRSETAGPNAQCALTPGLATNNESLAPDSLENPSEFLITTPGNGALFDEVSPESLAVISLPGFSRGIDPENVGIDIFIPNSGIANIDGADDARREEETDNVPVLSIGHVDQVIQANAEKAAIGRTVRGGAFILEDDNFALNTAVQAVAQAGPNLRPSLDGLGEGSSLQFGVNQNLILSANRVRLPSNSYTAYHGGLGSVRNDFEIGEDVRDNYATYNSVWVGLSPVIDRDLDIEQSLDIGPRQVSLASGAEGGANSDIDLNTIIEVELPGGDAISLNPRVIEDFYTQIYLTFFETPITTTTETELSEDTDYWPHVSFSGVRTNLNTSFRY
ncbi:MAG: hypothetical protein AAF974_12525, partial [Cyanobacteria bacterium P01_E01_bin.34]